MTDYALSLESGPQHRKTMVHVFDLLGCVANGPTTEAALAVTPEAIEAYLRFLQSIGEEVDADGFTMHVEEHVTEGGWLGNGSPYANFTRDLEPVSQPEVEAFMVRFHGLRELLATWSEDQGDRDLDASPREGRTARGILLHILAVPGSYLSPVLGGVTGFSRVATMAERGEISLAGALRQVEALAVERVQATTAEERSRVLQRPKEIRTLRKAIRRILEHDWEHLRELSRRQGGPSW